MRIIPFLYSHDHKWHTQKRSTDNGWSKRLRIAQNHTCSKLKRIYSSNTLKIETNEILFQSLLLRYFFKMKKDSPIFKNQI